MMPKDIEQEIKDVIVPKVEIVTREGKPTSIDDYDNFMQFLMLASIASQAVKIRKYFDDRKSQGWIQDFNITATARSEEFKPVLLAQSISITNDALVGGALVWVSINNRFNSRRTLNPRETLEVNFETHELECFFVQCPAGLTANLRATVKG